MGTIQFTTISRVTKHLLEKLNGTSSFSMALNSCGAIIRVGYIGATAKRFGWA